jgi:uncharacterized lipoprotein YddW (UPF0748 family)
MKKTVLFVLFLSVLHLCVAQTALTPQAPKRELRAAWIATVNNIDWPSKPGLSAEEQKAELISYLDLFKKMNLNAVVMQVRPCADAFYVSQYEPWSEFLTGKQGTDPGYDPLQFAIAECHKRCMELHAWLNPYRASRDNDYTKLAPNHPFKQHPEWFVPYKEKTYFDPAIPESRGFVCKVVKDIVTRYDVDAIHFDDYFYPYSDFNDSWSFVKYNRGYAAAKKDDWRRENVDILIKMLRDTIKSVKPYVKFGISPYAVWRNKRDDQRGSDTQSFSYTNYDHLYADIRLWLEKGWIDYVLPQLYFSIGYSRLDFRTVADWWAGNSYNHGLYAGIGTYRLDKAAKDSAWHSTDEIVRQSEYIRKLPVYGGFCYFNARNFKDNVMNINEVIEKKVNPYPALVPPLPGLPANQPLKPAKLKYDKNQRMLSWSVKDAAGAMSPRYFVIYRFPKGEKPDFGNAAAIVSVVNDPRYQINSAINETCDIYVTALDRLFNESKPSKRIKIR